MDADRDDFLGQVEFTLPGGRLHDAFAERTYALGKKKIYATSVHGAGAFGSKRLGDQAHSESELVISGRETPEGEEYDADVTGTLTLALRKEMWTHKSVDSLDCEIDREELLRFCILNTLQVDVRPPFRASGAGLMSNALKAVGNISNRALNALPAPALSSHNLLSRSSARKIELARYVEPQPALTLFPIGVDACLRGLSRSVTTVCHGVARRRPNAELSTKPGSVGRRSI